MLINPIKLGIQQYRNCRIDSTLIKKNEALGLLEAFNSSQQIFLRLKVIKTSGDQINLLQDCRDFAGISRPRGAVWFQKYEHSMLMRGFVGQSELNSVRKLKTDISYVLCFRSAIHDRPRKRTFS